MPFAQRKKPTSPAAKNGLVRIAPLYPNEAGNTLSGTVRTSESRKGQTISLGEEIQAIMEECETEGLDLRLLVFESTFEDGPPYSACLAKGRPIQNPEERNPAPEPAPEPPEETPDWPTPAPKARRAQRPTPRQ